MPRRIFPILAVSFCASSGAVSAGETHCSLVDDATERSACYAASTDASPPKSSKNWLVAKSKAAGSVAVIRSASQEVMCADKVGSFSLGLTCKEKHTGFYISAGCQMGETGDERAISVRLDDQAASEETLTVANNKYVLNLSDDAEAERFMKSLLGPKRLEIGVTPPSGARFTATFELGDLAAKIRPLREACSW